jgi:amino acid transporter
MLKEKEQKKESKTAPTVIGLLVYIVMIVAGLASVIFIPAYTSKWVFTMDTSDRFYWVVAWIVGAIAWAAIIGLIYGIMATWETIKEKSRELGNKILRRE